MANVHKSIWVVGLDQTLSSLLAQMLLTEGFEAEALSVCEIANWFARGDMPEVLLLSDVANSEDLMRKLWEREQEQARADFKILGLTGLDTEAFRERYPHITFVDKVWVSGHFSEFVRLHLGKVLH